MPSVSRPLIVAGYYLPPDDDAKAFVTYRNYTDAFLWLVNDLYPTNSDLVNAVKSLPGFNRARAMGLDESEIVSQLHGAWSTELLMAESLKVSSSIGIRYANIWSPVQSYYSVFSASIAWLRAIGDRAVAHKTVGNVITSEFNRTDLNIAPWSTVCNGCSVLSSESYINIPTGTDCTVSNLMIPRDAGIAWGLVGKSLKTTRNEQLGESFQGWLKGQKTATGTPRKNVPSSVKTQIGDRFPSTSWVHLLYRLRIRSNYKEMDSFAVGALHEGEARDFYKGQLQLTSKNLLLLESLIVGVMGVDFMNNAIASFTVETAPIKERWREVSSLF